MIASSRKSWKMSSASIGTLPTTRSYGQLTKNVRSKRWIAPSLACPDRKSTRLNSSHLVISYAVFCFKKKKSNASQNSYVPWERAASEARLPSSSCLRRCILPPCELFFFFNDTATTEIYTLSLHDSLPI